MCMYACTYTSLNLIVVVPSDNYRGYYFIAKLPEYLFFSVAKALTLLSILESENTGCFDLATSFECPGRRILGINPLIKINYANADTLIINKFV